MKRFHQRLDIYMGRFLLLALVAVLFCGCTKITKKSFYTTDQYGSECYVDTWRKTITVKGYTYKFSIRGNTDEYVLVISDRDDRKYTESKVGDLITGDYNQPAYGGFYIFGGPRQGSELADLVRPLVPEPGIPEGVIPGLVLVLLGGVNLWFPNLIFFFRYGTYFREIEPSRRFRLIHAILFGGIIAVGIYCILF